MGTSPNYTVIGAGHGGKAMAAHLALMGFPCDTVQPYPRPGGSGQGTARDRPGELRRRPQWVRAAGCRHLRHGASPGGGGSGHGRRAVLRTRRGGQECGSASPRRADRRVASWAHLGRHRVPQGALRSGLPGRCHRRRSRHLHLRQPFRWPGAGAHLPHQRGRAVGCAAGDAHARKSWKLWRRPIRNSSTASTCCAPVSTTWAPSSTRR